MQLLPTTGIVVPPRQRKSIAPGPLNELKNSIAERGLLHALVIYDNTLIAGGRRLRACEELHKAGAEFYFDGQPVPKDTVPTVTLAEYLTEADRFELELDENSRRVDLDWREKNEALAALHALRATENSNQTSLATADELLAKGPVLGSTHRNAVGKQIREAVFVAKHMHVPAVAKARNATEAFALAAKHAEEFAKSRLAKLQQNRGPQHADIQLRHCDSLTTLPSLEEGIVDLILADPPYGIEAGAGGFRARTIHHHNYDDDVATARALAQSIITEGFRICKPRANLFLFASIDSWDWFKVVAKNMGWAVFPRPLVWGKSDSEGLAPWGGQGPRITTEYIFYATKGQRGLVSSPIDYLRFDRVPRHERIYGAQKPVALLRKLIECSTLPGDLVLDPCAGSGSTLKAASGCGRRALGLEKDEDAYNTALANIYGDGDADTTSVDEKHKGGTITSAPELSSTGN